MRDKRHHFRPSGLEATSETWLRQDGVWGQPALLPRHAQGSVILVQRCLLLKHLSHGWQSLRFVLASVPSILDEKRESQSKCVTRKPKTSSLPYQQGRTGQRQAHFNAKSKELLRENINWHFQWGHCYIINRKSALSAERRNNKIVRLVGQIIWLHNATNQRIKSLKIISSWKEKHPSNQKSNIVSVQQKSGLHAKPNRGGKMLPCQDPRLCFGKKKGKKKRK